MKTLPLVSIVIATYQKPEYLRACLACLSATEFPVSAYEVIVVNDGSPDWTQQFLNSFDPPYNLNVLYQDNRGRAAARNAGVAASSGALLVMLDNDCMLAPSAISRLWHHHEKWRDRLLLSRVQHVAVEHVPNVLVEIMNGSLSFMERADSLKPEDQEYALQSILPLVKQSLAELTTGWIAAQGAAISIPADQFRARGGFDESFCTYGMEDFDLGFRFWISGGELIYAEDALLFHLDHGHDKLSLLTQSARSVRHFYEKHAHECESKHFLNFLIGKTSFLEFNNIVARLRDRLPVDKPMLDRRCSAYAMIRYRDEQRADLTKSQVTYSYNQSQEFCLGLLLNKVAGDISRDAASEVEEFTSPLPGSKILVVAPHMDDEVIGCGGLIQEYKRQHAHVTVAFCTSGSGVPRKLGRADTLLLSEERVEESKRAMAVLEVDKVEMFCLPDRKLGDCLISSWLLRDLLQKEQFDVIYTPGPDEFHPDHKAVWRWVTSEAALTASSADIFCYEVWGSCRPDRVLPIDDQTWRRKLQALHCYHSQLRVLDYQRLATLISESRGQLADQYSPWKHAEAFRKVSLIAQ